MATPAVGATSSARAVGRRLKILQVILLVALAASALWLVREVRRESTHPARAVVSSSAPSSGPLLAGSYSERQGVFNECTNAANGSPDGIVVRTNGVALFQAGMRVDHDGDQIRCAGVQGTVTWARSGAPPTRLPTMLSIVLVVMTASMGLGRALQRRADGRDLRTDAKKERDRDRRRAGLVERYPDQ